MGVLHQTMMYRIEMDVIDVIVEISIITDGVLLIAALPDGSFVFGLV
jgi:hypothetical protein